MPACSPDGQWIAFGHTERNRREILVIPSSGGPAVALTDGSSFAGEPAWSPDGSWIAFLSDASGGNRIWIVPVANGRPTDAARQLSPGRWAQALPVWSPDGTRIAYSSDDGNSEGGIWFVNVRGRPSPTRVTSGGEAVAVRWPALDRLFVSGLWGGASYGVRAVSLTGGAATPVADVMSRSANAAFFDVSRDGRILVLTWEERRGNIWALEATSRIY